MAAQELNAIARSIVADHKGVLAADESTGTIKKRFDSIGVESTEENRRAYRNLLFTTPGCEEYVGGVILYDETIRQASDDGTPFPELLEDEMERARRDLVAALDRVVGVHQHLRLDDRHDAGLLREGRIAGERVGVDMEAGVGGDAVADRDHGAPLAEARAERVVLREAGAQAVEALRHLLARMSREVLRSRVDLDPRDDALRREQLRERRAVVGRLADRLVVHDHTADVLLEARGREEQVPVRAAVVLRRLDADRVEALLDRARRLVSREHALVVCHDRLRDRPELVRRHQRPPSVRNLRSFPEG
jgi:hypothetical protein